MPLAISGEDLARPSQPFSSPGGWGVLNLLKLDWVGFDGDVQTPGVGSYLVTASISPRVPGRE